jgi:twitching motility two-component system response regulator PilH
MSFLDRLLGGVRKPTDRPDAPSAPAAAPTERRRRKRVNARQGTRVLIIDDSPTVVAVLRKTLASAGYETREALDAERGLALIAEAPPDLIFLDIILPGMNGFNALRTIRRLPASQHIPVIMISGNEHATEQFYANRIGADDFMKKPFSRHEIFARIEALLDGQFVPRRRGDALDSAATEVPPASP